MYNEEWREEFLTDRNLEMIEKLDAIPLVPHPGFSRLFDQGS